MNEFSNIAEYSVQKSRSAFYRVMKIVVPIVTGVMPILYSVLMLFAYGFPLFPLAIISLSVLFLFISARNFRRIDYDYRVVDNELYFSIVYNRKKRKELGSIDISRLDKFAPYSGTYYDEAAGNSYVKVYDLSSSVTDPYVFYAVEKDEESGNKTLYIFNASDKMLKLIKTYNRRAIITYPNE